MTSCEAKDDRNKYACQEEAHHVLPQSEILDPYKCEAECTNNKGNKECTQSESLEYEIVGYIKAEFTSPVLVNIVRFGICPVDRILICFSRNEEGNEDYKKVKGKDKEYHSRDEPYLFT